MTHNTQHISPLRQRMLEDMTLRKLSPRTQTAYIRAVKNFTRFIKRSPDTACAEDLRQFQLYLVEQGVSSSNLNATIQIVAQNCGASIKMFEEHYGKFIPNDRR